MNIHSKGHLSDAEIKELLLFKKAYLLKIEIEQINVRKNNCVKEQKFEFAVAFRDKEQKLKKRLVRIEKKILPGKTNG